MSRPCLDPRLAWLDVETGGLVPGEADCIEIFCASVDGVFHNRLAPQLPVHPKAAEVNGYTPEGWAAYSPISQEDLVEIGRIMLGKIPAGHNVSFDLGFLEFEYRRAGLQRPQWSHRKCDTQAMAMPLYLFGHISSAALASCVKELGIGEQPKIHTAVEDIALSMALYDRLVQVFGLVD